MLRKTTNTQSRTTSSESPLDSWDKEASSYHDQYAKNNSSPYGYGVSDMNYYGTYSSVPGYGMMWQPYFTGVGWDPFMDGAWGFYPGFGYMFASAYPWGWMPYRYGNWALRPRDIGWRWQPGTGTLAYRSALHRYNRCARNSARSSGNGCCENSRGRARWISCPNVSLSLIREVGFCRYGNPPRLH